jgi:hypothetical protein
VKAKALTATAKLFSMRTWLALLILVLLPLQLTWAAAGNYCQHEGGSAASHMGHHVHKHGSSLGDKTQENPSKLGATDADCSTCHAGSAFVLYAQLPHVDTSAAFVLIEGQQKLVASPPLGVPDRPQWLPLA